MTIDTPKESLLIIILTLVVVTSGFDLMTDLSHGATYGHITKESATILLSVSAILWLLHGLREQAREITQLKHDLAQINVARKQPDEYVLAARKQVGEVIAKQFNDWELTTSEKEVGLLLLKGLSLKEIAALRNTLEKTVRQQASAIYKKAGISGRHEFSAWFIEDFL